MKLDDSKYIFYFLFILQEIRIEPLTKTQQGFYGAMMQECVWHVAAGLLSFLSWMYCVNVMSDKHAVDTTTGLQFALLLLTSLVRLLVYITDRKGKVLFSEANGDTSLSG